MGEERGERALEAPPHKPPLPLPSSGSMLAVPPPLQCHAVDAARTCMALVRLASSSRLDMDTCCGYA